MSVLTRRIMLMEEEDKKSAETLRLTVTNLAIKLDELSRRIEIQEAELRRAVEKAELDEKPALPEKNLKGIEDELETVGENMKQLEAAAEKAAVVRLLQRTFQCADDSLEPTLTQYLIVR